MSDENLGAELRRSISDRAKRFMTSDEMIRVEAMKMAISSKHDTDSMNTIASNAEKIANFISGRGLKNLDELEEARIQRIHYENEMFFKEKDDTIKRLLKENDKLKREKGVFESQNNLKNSQMKSLKIRIGTLSQMIRDLGHEDLLTELPK